MLPPEFVARFNSVRDEHGTHTLYKFRLALPNGSERIANIAIAPLVTRNFVAVGRIILVDDITDRIQLEAQLTQSEKLSSIGLLAAGVAHEVNTPLAVISSYTQMLTKHMRDDERLAPVLEKITQQTFRASEIVNGLLNFSRTSGTEFTSVNLNDLLGDTVTLLEHQFKTSQIRVETNLDPHLARIHGNQGKLQQVILNLMLNAKDAMFGTNNATLKIATFNGPGRVLVRIQDSGGGIEKEHLHRIYDPFFTTKTKPQDGRTQRHRPRACRELRNHAGARRQDPRRERARRRHCLPAGVPGLRHSSRDHCRGPRGQRAGHGEEDDPCLRLLSSQRSPFTCNARRAWSGALASSSSMTRHAIRESLDTLLTLEGFSVSTAGDGASGLELLSRNEYDLLLLDLALPGESGIDLLPRIVEMQPNLPVIMITAYGTVGNVVDAIRAGAENFVQKPWDNEKLLADIRAAIARHRAEEEVVQLKRTLKQRYNFENIVGKSEPMLRLFDLIAQVAPSRSTVLIQGESGTGKELIAKAIHANSPRRDRPFVPVNTGAVPSELLESTLFGHVKGAFTSAVTAKKGLFEVANGGTLFLDEIGTMGMDMQAKILRVLQDRRFMHLGGVQEIQVDVRIIAATNVNLQEAVREGRFREDLFYRLNVICLELPPLRSRREDIPLLAAHFLKFYAEENGTEDRSLSPEAMRIIMDYEWPGNVRELENAMERGVVLSTSRTISARSASDTVDREHLLGKPSRPSSPTPPSSI